MSWRRRPDLILSTSPYLHDPASTPRVMGEVIWATVPVMAVAVWVFGVGCLLVVAASVLGAVGTEWVFSRRKEPSPIRDRSALLTGILLGLILPPGFPLWMAFLGGFVGIGLGKLIWGGLGQNQFNPALVGRAFLQASFPTAITTWVAPADQVWRVPEGLLVPPLMGAATDAVSAATPLGLFKFSGQLTAILDLFLGKIGGSIGETSALVLILCGIWLGWRRIFDWRLPVSTLATVFVFSAVFYLAQPERFPSPWMMLFSGGLLFGAVFMVTDPVTTPTTTKGAWIFGLGVGILVVLIRLFGGLPEGVMYGILLMNAVTPYINHYTQPRQFGGPRKSWWRKGGDTA
ncbi:MAG TPA: RnfABCDGE type electron transport complex subunit D [Acidobacteriota bacterium]|nr:RnfABCDGE type electron transport complex subunit D [Acidobacteriota bacterium]HRV08231.1 RnfABCDGE type electron transport complex subunit D [Acidobacteriota bacterium]